MMMMMMMAKLDGLSNEQKWQLIITWQRKKQQAKRIYRRQHLWERKVTH